MYKSLCKSIRSNKLLSTLSLLTGKYLIPLTLNWNYSEAFVLHFTIIIYGLHTKIQHLISYVCPLAILIVVFSSAMYVNFCIQNFEAVIKKSTFGFLFKSTNSLVMAIES